MSAGGARALAWERWYDLGRRVEDADTALGALIATASTSSEVERLTAKRAGVAEALRLWNVADAPGPTRGAVSVYADALDLAVAEAREAGDGTEPGLALVKDYLRAC